MSHTSLNVVAQKAGVSKTTASLVLNGKADKVNIAPGTQERVRKVARELNYQPNRFNPGRLNGKTGIIAVVATDFSSYPNYLWLHHLIVSIQAHGYVVVPILSGANPEQSIDHIAADGYVIIDEAAADLFPQKPEPGFPVVCAGFKTKTTAFKGIHPNYRERVNEMISALYRHNKKAIGLVAQHGDNPSTNEMIKTYKENYCDRFEIPENIAHIPQNDWSPQTILKACLELVEKEVNGIVFESGAMALRALSQKEARQLSEKNILFASHIAKTEFQTSNDDIILAFPDNIEEMANEVVEVLFGKLLPSTHCK
ncbi:LacI family DNA-binding transcriptional regulator [Thermophagus sp. OGC60D27]|uniref:LacI family DNA-binding transcriptional regulator n=1 Tax=Thermophagus sp. OGC60D27 TaxID=3458415 RepID=UPI0040382FAB